jgi:hypothetical protein
LLEHIKKFLLIIEKDSAYLTFALLDHKLFPSLRSYIRRLDSKELENIVVPIIVKNYRCRYSITESMDKWKYFHLILETLLVSEKIIRPLLLDCPEIGDCQDAFTHFLLSEHSYSLTAVKNYLGYLAEHNPQALSPFEDKLLETDKEHLIRQYALHLPLNNKRKILRLLISSKQEDTLVEFIKKYPEFESLLPML